MNFVIVESPTKAKTISKFLGKDFKVESSFGHVRDLPKSKMGIDTENNFEPTYVIPTKARKRVNALKKEAAKADEIILASDEDREGEAIAWHLVQALGLEDPKKIKRIVFHEITKPAIEKALENPREIDLNLVDAQQARRILDRLVGYELSPFLWKKMFKGLSAGRVQSVAVRLIVDREREIEKFKPVEFWSVEAELEKTSPEPSSGSAFVAKLVKKDGKLLDKFAVKNKKEADEIVKDLENAEYKVEQVTKKEVKRQPKPPFTTSTLQQASANNLHFSAKQTMMFAQQLYEKGFITYMRTDSVNLSAESLASAQKTIAGKFGKEFSLSEPRKFKTKSKGAQEAHEAVRPSDPAKTPEDLKTKLDEKQFKLYDLIWRRFIACQMQEAIFDSTTVDIATAPLGDSISKWTFRASGSIMKFEGWLKVYPASFTENLLPELNENEMLELEKLLPNQHFTEPPPRYSEATLVKALEEYGIGRPSTYAPTISTIQTRNYIEKNEQRRFIPTETGLMVNDILTEHFPQIVDIGFTAKMEEEFDDIAEGKTKWEPVIKNFYQPFHKNLMEKYDEVEKKHTDEETDEKCEKCGKPMIIKHGRFGKFLACSGFPDCKNAKAIKKESDKIGMKCPKCPPEADKQGDVIKKFTKTKRIFFGCSNWPKCDFASWKNPMEEEGKKEAPDA
ncbi:MAG: type I DNA topoisomerase [bacterium]|nr:type I DNA topoisomerase [bacterium]